MIFKRYGLIAHRGLHDRARGVPENSLPAFECAVAGGYAIELDIHLTKDGQAVVFQAATLKTAHTPSCKRWHLMEQTAAFPCFRMS